MSERWTLSEESEPVSPATITLVEGSSFTICDLGGDIVGRGRGPVRRRHPHLLPAGAHGRRPDAGAADGVVRSLFSASFVARTLDRALLVFRDVWIGRGMCIEVRLRNLDQEPRTAEVRLAVGADLADLFEVKRGQPVPAAVHRTVTGSTASFVELDGQRSSLSSVGSHGRGGRRRVAALGGRDRPGRGGPLRRAGCCGAASKCRPGTAAARRPRWPRRPPARPPGRRAEPALGRAGLATAPARSGSDLGALRIFDPASPTW